MGPAWELAEKCREHAEASSVLLKQQLWAASLLTCGHPLGWPGFKPFTLAWTRLLFTEWKLGQSARKGDALAAIRSGSKTNGVGAGFQDGGEAPGRLLLLVILLDLQHGLIASI